VPPDALTALLYFALAKWAFADSIYAISLSLNKEMAKENQPKGLMPFGIPQRAN
jgi:hypothetical protein